MDPQPPVVINSTIPSETQSENITEQEHEYPSLPKLALITLGLCVSILMVGLDTAIIATAIPHITSVFNSLDDVGWYGSAYLLTTTSLQPSFGKIYANFNLKIVFLCSLVLFEGGSVICAAATSSTMLIVGRAVAGCGAAGLFSGSLNIIAVCVPLRTRALYVGLVSSMVGISSVCGPLIGGALTDKVSWRWCFWINLPIGGLAFCSVLLFFSSSLQESRPGTLKEKLGHIDFFGAVFIIGAAVCSLLALQWGGVTYDWSDSKVWGLFIGFALNIAIFIVIQIRRGDRATIPPAIFTNRTVLAASVFTAMIGVALYVHIYFVPFYFQSVQGVSAVESGIRTIPRVIPMVLTNIVVGALVSHLGTYVYFLWAGVVIFIAGSATLTTLGVDTSAGKWIGYQILSGVGSGPCMQLPIFAVQAVLTGTDVPVGMSIALFFNNFGAAIGVSLGHTILSNVLIKNIPKYAPGVDPHLVVQAGGTGFRDLIPPDQLPGVLEAYANAIDRAFLLPVACGGAAFFIGLFVERVNIKKKRAGDDQEAKVDKRNNGVVNENEKAETTS